MHVMCYNGYMLKKLTPCNRCGVEFGVRHLRYHNRTCPNKKLKKHAHIWINYPYALQRMPDGEFLLLNRRYKPLGTDPRSDYVDYSLYSTIPLDQGLVESLSINDSPAPDVGGGCHIYWLYNDETSPSWGHRNFARWVRKLEALGLRWEPAK